MVERIPVLLYDGACGFCTRSVELAIGWLPRGRVEWQPYQTEDLAAYGLSEAEVASSVHLVETSGRITHGAAAVGRVLVLSGGAAGLVGRLILAPPVAWLAEAAYRLVSAVRHRLPGTTPALARLPEDRPGAAR